MEICTEQVTITTAGEAGAAVGSADTPAMHGFLLDIDLNWSGDAPATSDLTVADDNGNVLAISDSSTDVFVAPRQKVVDNTNTDLTGMFDRFPLNGKLTFSIAQCDALAAALVATVRYLRL